jgi:hypothetical protein
MNSIYGFAWFGGSVLLGVLYDRAGVGWVVAVAVAFQMASLPMFRRLLGHTAVSD